MRFRPAYLTSLVGSASAVLCFAITLAIPVTIPTIPEASPQASAEPKISDTVNRTSKTDRLRVIVRPPDAEPFEVQGPARPPPKLLDGCESAFSPMDHSSAAKLARSCTT